MVIGWSVTLSIIVVRTRSLPRWLGLVGLAVSVLYLLNLGDILAIAVAGFPAWNSPVCSAAQRGVCGSRPLA
jgi:hypothetical protein